MFGTVIDKARFGLALARGRDVPDGVVSRLIRSAGETYRVHGAATGTSGARVLNDGEASHELLEDTVRYASTTTRYWANVLDGVDLRTSHHVAALTDVVPITTSGLVAEAGAEMTATGVYPVLCAQTTGTTGTSVQVPFTQSDLASLIATTGITAGLTGALRAGDRVQISTGSRAVLGNTVFSRAAMHLGAQVLMTGQTFPHSVLETLKTWQANVLLVWPSYLGAIVTAAEGAGHDSRDFALRTIFVGGELVTTGLIARAQAVFGGHVEIVEGFGCTETLPVAGGGCEDGHLHLDTASGHIEFVQLDHDQPAAPGQMARLVVTPYSIYRRAMPLLRYDAGDLVTQTVGHACSRAATPAIIVHGKRAHMTYTATGPVTSRDILEAVESIPGIALPLRCGTARSSSGELGLEVVGPIDADAVGDACNRRRVPITYVRQVGAVTDLRNPIHRRADLAEAEYQRPGLDDGQVAAR